MNEWVLVNGCILGILTDGPCGINTTSVETLDELWLYCYTSCMLGRAPRTKETLPDFYGTQQCGIGSPEIHKNYAG